MVPGKYNPKFPRGDTWNIPIATTNSDGSVFVLTGYTAKSQLRETTESTAVILELTCTITNAAQGKLEISAPASTTKDIAVGKYAWDIQISDALAGTVFTLLSGTFTVLADVTRA